MATASRNEKRKRRLRRNVSIYRRALEQTETQRQSIIVTLLAVLAQKGGEITITKGTINQVIENIKSLGFSTTPGATDGEYVVRMTTKEDADAHTAIPTPEDTVDDCPSGGVSASQVDRPYPPLVDTAESFEDESGAVFERPYESEDDLA